MISIAAALAAVTNDLARLRADIATLAAAISAAASPAASFDASIPGNLAILH